MNLIENTIELYRNSIETMKVKNADYSGKDHKFGLRNFELSANLAKIKMSQGILVRIMDKITRISNLIEQDANVKDESIYDTISDAINYLAILYYAIQEENKEEKQESS